MRVPALARALWASLVAVPLVGCPEPVREGHGPLWDPTDGASETSTGMGSTGDDESADGGSTDIGDDGQTSGMDPGEEACPRARVTVMSALNVRPTPSTQNPEVGELANGTIVDVVGSVHGEQIGDSDLWLEIAYGTLEGFVFAAYAECTTASSSSLEPGAGEVGFELVGAVG
jgi:hypothetical protein